MAVNPYEKRYNDIGWDWQGFSNTTLSFTSAGASIGGGLGAAIGFLIGGALGGFGAYQSQQQKQNELYEEARDDLEENRIQLGSALDSRTSIIKEAQGYISNTRSSIDSIYGEGTYDIFDSLFTTIFDMPDGSSLSDVFENASVSSYEGIAGTAGGTTDAMSLNDISAGYQEYLKSIIRRAGGKYELYDQQEKNLINNYFSNIEQYRLEMSKQFVDTFMQKVESDVSGATDMGSTEVAQANTGFRQTGGGTALTTYQQFQNDLADMAYSSSLNYALRQMQLQMENANTSLIAGVNQIRTENAISVRDELLGLINNYNEWNSDLSESFDAVESIEGSVDEILDENEDIYEFLGNHDQSYTEIRMEDYF